MWFPQQSTIYGIILIMKERSVLHYNYKVGNSDNYCYKNRTIDYPRFRYTLDYRMHSRCLHYRLSVIGWIRDAHSANQSCLPYTKVPSKGFIPQYSYVFVGILSMKAVLLVKGSFLSLYFTIFWYLCVNALLYVTFAYCYIVYDCKGSELAIFSYVSFF